MRQTKLRTPMKVKEGLIRLKEWFTKLSCAFPKTDPENTNDKDEIFRLVRSHGTEGDHR